MTNRLSGDSMLAAGLTEFGGPEVLRTIELPRPFAQGGDVVVRVVAATVNPTDTLLRAGRQAQAMAGLTPPYIPGMEFAGYVHQVGDHSSSLRVGQPVMGIVNPRRAGGGAQAQYVCVPAASLAPVDDTTDLAAAATIPMNGLTAKMALEALALAPGDTVLVTGGAGALGGYAIQMARHAGLVVVADASARDVDLLRALGADAVVPRGESMVDAVRDRYPAGVDGLIDAARLGQRAAGLVRDGGTMVWVRKTNELTDGRLRHCFMAAMEQVTNTAALTWLAALLRDGVLTPRIARRLPLGAAAEAHRLVEQGGLRGRVVLLLDQALADLPDR